MSVGAPSRSAVVCGALGGGLLFTGLVLIFALPAILRHAVAKNIMLQPDSMFFNLWTDIPVPFYFSVYFFEMLNPDEILAGAKPAVQQRGPYVYREYREKRNITFHDNGTVSFLEYRHYHFEEDMSNGTESDYVLIPNLLVMGASVILENAIAPVRIAVSTAFSLFKQKAFLNRTVGEVLWGYEDPLVKFLNNIVPGLVPYGDKFGILVDFNNTHSGRFTINTGAADISKIHMVDNWNGLKKVSYWRSDQCNQINGTSGEIWPPFMTPSTPLEFYSPDFCRSMSMHYKESGEFQGVPIYRYGVSKTLFANGTEYPPNEGFCPCRQSGIQNMSSCRLNVPLFLSQPHFYNGDPQLLETVDGLHPSAEKHDLYLEMQPLIGVPMNVSVKLQLSLFVKRVPLIVQTGRINPVVLPLLWFEEHGVIDEGLINQFYGLIVLVPTLLEYLPYGVIGFGALLLMAMGILWLRNKGDLQAKALQTVDPQAIRQPDLTSAPLLQKDLSPNIHENNNRNRAL